MTSTKTPARSASKKLATAAAINSVSPSKTAIARGSNGLTAMDLTVTQKNTVAQPLPTAIDPTKTVEDNTGTLQRIGYIESLETLSNDLRDQAKAMCFTAGAKRIKSANFEGQISGGGVSDAGPVDVVKFIKRCQKKGIKLKDINAALSVTKDKARALLSEAELTNVCQPGGARGSWKLTVTLRDDVPAPSLVQAVQSLAMDQAAGKIPMSVPKR